MKRLLLAALVLQASCLPSLARAVSLSGIVLYKADYSGIPNNISETTQGNLRAQLWRTQSDPYWYGLGVWLGMPPDSLNSTPLNAPSLILEYPLNDGETAFTLLAEPGLDDEFDKFSLNLYFDGALAGAPGISVLFDKNAPPSGAEPTANRPDYLYSFLLEHQPGAKPQTFYDDGINRVTVAAASFLKQQQVSSDWNFDLMWPHKFGKSGEKDLIGMLKLLVGPSEGSSGTLAGGSGSGVAPAVTGLNTGASGGAPYVGNPAYGGGVPSGGGVPAASGLPADAGSNRPYQQPSRGTPPNTAAAAATADRETESTAGSTPAADPTPGATTPTAARTPSSKTGTGTPVRGTATPASTVPVKTPTRAAPIRVAPATAYHHPLMTPTPGRPRSTPTRRHDDDDE
ncbi:MAG: hypothetical protein HY270_02380 [Deltaproteobacteria bacterium]|nr:hypothetical protein [Deltaproteobacteria bacterium]